MRAPNLALAAARLTRSVRCKVKEAPRQIESHLLELQDACLVRERLPDAVRQHILSLRATDFPTAQILLEYIGASYPDTLLSDDYRKKKAIAARERRQVLREGEYSPALPIPPLPERTPGEADATPKQKRFLRTLGVRDEVLLHRIGKRQASFLIESAIEKRGEILSQPAVRRPSAVSRPLAVQQKKGCILLLVPGIVALGLYELYKTIT